MHARILRFQGASNIDDGVAFVREKATPIVRQQKGYLGMSVSVDRSARLLNIMSSWNTEEDLKASEAALSGLRAEGAGVLGGDEPTITSYEVLLNEVGDQPPTEGCRLRVVATQVDPAHLDEDAAWLKSEVVPGVKATPGFRALRLMVDRSTGQGAVGTVWADEAALQGSEEIGKESREKSTARGTIQFSDISRREIVFIDAPT